MCSCKCDKKAADKNKKLQKKKICNVVKFVYRAQQVQKFVLNLPVQL